MDKPKLATEDLVKIANMLDKVVDSLYKDRIQSEIDRRVQYHVAKQFDNALYDRMEIAVKRVVEDSVLVEVKLKHG